MKYIMVRVTHKGLFRDMPVIFPELFVHSMAAEAVRRLAHQTFEDADEVEIVSAGFCNVRADCHGESETLDLKSRPEDSAIVATHRYGGGIGET